jgi:hypothetical protein
MTKDQYDALQSIANNIVADRKALLDFCLRAEIEDISEVGDGLPGSILYGLVNVAECIGEVDEAVAALLIELS